MTGIILRLSCFKQMLSPHIKRFETLSIAAIRNAAISFSFVFFLLVENQYKQKYEIVNLVLRFESIKQDIETEVSLGLFIYIQRKT